MLFIVIGAILAFLLTGAVLPMDTWYLNLSLFFAFAALYPDIQLLLFFVIPIKIKWLAMLDGLYFVYAIVQAFLPPTAEVSMAYIIRRMHLLRSSRS